MPKISPTLKCAAAIWPQARAVTRHHPTRLDQRAARKRRLKAASVSVVHARAPANGSETASSEPAIAMAMTRAPTVAEGLESSSLRRNQYIPRPASIGCKTIIQRIAAAQGSSANRIIGGRYSQPDCGSAANGVPLRMCGFQASRCP